VLDAPASNTMIFFQEIHVFLQLSSICLFGKKRAHIHLEKPTFRRYSFQKLTQFSQGNNVLDVLASTIHVFLWINTCVSSKHEWAYLEENEPISTLKILSCRMYSFQKLRQFSHEKNVLRCLPLRRMFFFGVLHVILIIVE
jgi:hypothetical protein